MRPLLALGPVGGDGVAVGQLVGPDIARAHVQPVPSGVTATSERAARSTEVTTARWEVTQAPPGPGAKRDDLVAGPVTPAAWRFQLRAGKLPQLLPHLPGGPVERSPRRHGGRRPSGRLCLRPRRPPTPDHLGHGLLPARAACTRPCSAYQPTAAGTWPARRWSRAWRSAGSRWLKLSVSVQTWPGWREARASRAPPGPTLELAVVADGHPVPRRPPPPRAAWPSRHRWSCRSRPGPGRGEGRVPHGRAPGSR